MHSHEAVVSGWLCAASVVASPRVLHGSVELERGPAPAPPLLQRTLTFEDEVRTTCILELATDRQSGVPPANNDGVILAIFHCGCLMERSLMLLMLPCDND